MDDPWIFNLAVQNKTDIGSLVFDLVIILVLVLINGFFSAAEMAIVNLKDAKIRKEAEEGNLIAAKLIYFLDNQANFLATIQVCITLAGFMSASFGADKLASRLQLWLDPERTAPWIGTLSVVIITFIISYISLVLGELVPKRLAMNNPERFARRFVMVLRVADILLRPMAQFLNFTANMILKLLHVPVAKPKEVVTEEEIRMLVDISSSSGNIHAAEGQMIDNIFELNDTEVNEIMTHRTNIVALPVTATFDELADLLASEKYSRIPIYEEDIDDIIGVVSIKDVVQYMIKQEKDKFDLRKIMRAPYLVPESKSVDALFKDMQRDHVSMAIVIDEYGGTAGLVSLEDVLEEIVGNIEDEYDEEDSDIILRPDGSYIVSGLLSLDEVEEKINHLNQQKDGTYREGTDELLFDEDDQNDFDTIAGLVLQRLGRIPDQKSLPYVEDERFIFHVIEMEDNRIAKIQLGIKWYNRGEMNRTLEELNKQKEKDKEVDAKETEEEPIEEKSVEKTAALLQAAALKKTNSSFVREFARRPDEPDEDSMNKE